MKVCILDAKTLGNDIDLSPIKIFGETKIYETTKLNEIYERTENAEIIIDNKVPLTAEILSRCKNLKLICLASTGTNIVDLDYVRKNKIAVTNVAGYSTNSVVQHTFALLFFLLDSLKGYDNYVKSGEYCKSDIFTYYGEPFIELYGKTFGIIGFGEIGQTVAKTAETFGCNIIFNSTTNREIDTKYKREELDELLRQSDIVSIHCGLNEKTKNLITYDKLCLMKKSACILNLGRGLIINENDLAKALDNNIIYAAGIDVLEDEPPKSDNPLLKIKNSDKLIITPHIAWASVEARTRLINEMSENIKCFLNGEKRNRVD